MRIVICDDEPRYRQFLHEKIVQDSFLHDYEAEIVEYESGRQLTEAVGRGMSADVFFLDVQMERGGDDGIRAARELRKRGEDGLIIYVTGFIDYVQDGYEVRAFRYLLKNQIPEKLPRILEEIREELAGQDYYFQSGGQRIRVDKRQIIYMESNRRQLHLVTSETEYSYYGNLDHAEKELGEKFLRCHRSYLVNMGQIRKVSAAEIGMKNGSVIPVSRSYGKEVKRRLLLECI